MLGFKPSSFTFLLFGLPEKERYHAFEVPKKSGGVRKIYAPTKPLRELQKRLNRLLTDCAKEIGDENPKFWASSHGFQRGRSILSNAEHHSKRAHVFNADIEDFFGSISFARVRGFFLKDRDFGLNEDVATAIAQIACHENALPQGSPASPIISNFIGGILDTQLYWLARRNQCTYSRYADDLTFSTDRKFFPEVIAREDDNGAWRAGFGLEAAIEHTGFRLNPAKTRMAHWHSRQSVTGLIVNERPNVSQEYYRTTRAMCERLFRTGLYEDPQVKTTELTATSKLDHLEGRLAHIHFVKTSAARNHKAYTGPARLYRKFLFFKYFAAPTRPLIVTERAADITYLRCAFRALAPLFPDMIHEIGFLKPAAKQRLRIASGSDGLAGFSESYDDALKAYAYKPMNHPVVLICGSKGAAERDKLITSARNLSGAKVIGETHSPSYFMGRNLYLVSVPEGVQCIEDLFPENWLTAEIDGKPFDPSTLLSESPSEAKSLFARRIVYPNRNEIKFSGFFELLQRIESCLQYHKTKRCEPARTSRK